MYDYVVHILQVPTHVRTIESVVLSELMFSDQNMDDWDRKIVALICKKIKSFRCHRLILLDILNTPVLD